MQPFSSAVPGWGRWSVNAFEVAITWEIEDDIFIPLRVTGIKQPVIPSIRRGHPDFWSPAEGGEIEDIKVYSGARLLPALEARLLADEAFIRAVDASI